MLGGEKITVVHLGVEYTAEYWVRPDDTLLLRSSFGAKVRALSRNDTAKFVAEQTLLELLLAHTGAAQSSDTGESAVDQCRR
ncbi:MAG: hypothetical protein AAF493_20175 [Pseudomonadota bacterium]